MIDDLIRDCRYIARVFGDYDEFTPSDIEMVILTSNKSADTIAALTARAERAEAARDNALEVAASKCDAAAAYRVKQINQLSGVLKDKEIYQKIRWGAGKIQAEILAGTIRAMKGDTA